MEIPQFDLSKIDESLLYYLPYQVAASLTLAITCVLAGRFLAWLIWGHHRRRFLKLKSEQKN